MHIFISCLALLLCPVDVFAHNNLDMSEHEMLYEITKELNCASCINQNVADSNSEFANMLREHIRKQIREGQTKKQIIDKLIPHIRE